jgi:flagellar biosynthetic protein FliQ
VSPESVLQLGRNALEMTLILAGPVLLFGLVAGLAVSVFQALTQIHEMTLTFIPKIAATILALALFGPWMLQKMLNYTSALFESIPGLVR